MENMNDNRKRKREDEQEIFYQQPQHAQNVQIIDPNNSLGVTQPLFINQLPVIQNQQLVYQFPHVQGVHSGGTAPENTYYVFIPVAETAEAQTLQKDETEFKTGQYVTYRSLGNEVKPGNSVITIDGVKETKEYEITQPQKVIEHQPVVRQQEVYVVDKHYQQQNVQQQTIQQQTIQQQTIQQPTVQATNIHQQIIQPAQVQQNSAPVQIQEPVQTPPSCQVQQSQATSNVNSQANSKWKHQLYRCDYSDCSEKFSSLHEKKLHQENHLYPEGEIFRCGICNMVFKKAIERNRHIESHSVVNTHKCKHCQKAFPYYTSLVAHVEEVQAEESLKCFFCERKFDDKVTFLRHNGWSMKVCKCGMKLCGDIVYQKHIGACLESGRKNK